MYVANFFDMMSISANFRKPAFNVSVGNWYDTSFLFSIKEAVLSCLLLS